MLKINQLKKYGNNCFRDFQIFTLKGGQVGVRIFQTFFGFVMWYIIEKYPDHLSNTNHFFSVSTPFPKWGYGDRMSSKFGNFYDFRSDFFLRSSKINVIYDLWKFQIRDGRSILYVMVFRTVVDTFLTFADTLHVTYHWKFLC